MRRACIKGSIAAGLLSIAVIGRAVEMPGETCRNNLVTNPELSALRAKVSLGSLKDQTFRMLTDETKPSPEEREAIVRWMDLRKDCYKLDEDFRAKMPAKAQEVYEAQQSNFEQAALELYEGKITYGGFAHARSEIMNRSKAQLSDVVSGMQQDQAAKKAQSCESARQDVATLCHSSTPQTNVQVNSGSGSISSNEAVRPWNGTEIIQCNDAKRRVQAACR